MAKGKKEDKSQKPAAKKQTERTLAHRFFDEAKTLPGINQPPKSVNNGIGLWVGNLRVLKWAKAFPQDCLLFPKRTRISTAFDKGEIKGKRIPKGSVQVVITSQNYGSLMTMFRQSITDAQMVVKKRQDDKAKRETDRKAKAAKAKTTTPKKTVEEKAKAAATSASAAA